MTRERPTRQAQVARLAEELRRISESSYPSEYEEGRVAVVSALTREIERLRRAGE
ncbi:MAG: hypothetical protein HY881_16010 [Deltaproteobacteria bacterium]|nr:hypothetical protein [Deltaproteobacteria bacterium]